MEHDEYGFPPYSSGAEDYPAALYYYTYQPGDYKAMGIELYQYAGESCWSCGGNPNTYSGWQFDAYYNHYTKDSTFAGVYLGQYEYSNAASEGAGTYGGFYVILDDRQVAVDLYQDRWNGSCEEVAYLSVDWDDAATLGPQPCTAEIPQLPVGTDLPPL